VFVALLGIVSIFGVFAVPGCLFVAILQLTRKEPAKPWVLRSGIAFIVFIVTATIGAHLDRPIAAEPSMAANPSAVRDPHGVLTRPVQLNQEQVTMAQAQPGHTSSNDSAKTDVAAVPVPHPSIEASPVSVVARHPDAKLTQTAYFDEMDRLYELFSSAPNEIKKSAAFRTARAFETEFFNAGHNTVFGWTGSITSLSTDKGGKNLRLSIELIYLAASELAEGQCVLFDGQINPKEGSFSERGAMSAPEYRFKFEALRACP
jgi:hypothetical protein